MVGRFKVKCSIIVGLFLAFATLSSGCFLVRLFQKKKSLKNEKVTSIKVSLLSGSPSLCPGQKDTLVVNATTKEGKLFSTKRKSYSEAPVGWGNYAVDCYGCVHNGKGVIQVDKDPREVWNKTVRYKATLVHKASLVSQATTPITFQCKFIANHGGAWGRKGRDGLSGSRGRQGTGHASSGSAARPGGHGERGGDGRDGGPGGNGRDADNLSVRIALVQQKGSNHKLLQVNVLNLSTRKTELYVVDPNGGKLFVKANGGAGGDGGAGGHGGTGGGAGTGAPNGDGGAGGHGGNGGDGGDGGNGGSIDVVADLAARPYINTIVFSNRGGGAGRAGRGGTGGNSGPVFSGGQAGPRGRPGRKGRRGRFGRDGDPVTLRYRNVAPTSMKPSTPTDMPDRNAY